MDLSRWQNQRHDHSHPRKVPKLSEQSRFTSHLSADQWQELELQALIYRYIMAGVPVPNELLVALGASHHHHLPSSPFFHHLGRFSFYNHTLMQSGYWGRAALDPEPGRCRRTDGKKWRCSRDVVPGQKYCERHVHRGRNRSRKHVETSASTSDAASSESLPVSGISPSADLLPLNHSTVDCGPESDGRVLRSFFDDWPGSAHKRDTIGVSSLSSCVSMSASDVALKLATGSESRGKWPSCWASATHSESMGGPLAEAFRSNNMSNSSPSSVLLNISQVSGSEATSFCSS